VRPFLILLVLVGHMSSAFGQPRVVDLDAPGALEALALNNRGHYERVRAILSEVQAQPEADVPRWLEARFDARDVAYGALLLTSLPPKRHLSFAIDDVRYHTLLTVQGYTATTQRANELFAQGMMLEAQVNSGASYARGGGEAVNVYVRAAQLGSAAAAKRLAEIHEKGLLGLPRDHGEAQKWRNAARVLGQ